MKYQEKQKRKRTAAAVIALLIVLAMVAGLVTPFIAYAAPVSTQTVTMTNGGTTGTAQATPSTWQEKEFGQEQFTLDVVVGFDGEYIVGKTAPLKGIITNNGAPFRGELQAKAYTYENTGRYGVESASAEYAVYYQELELLQGASQKIDMELNIGTIQRFLQITLVDESGRTVFLQNVDLKPKQPETLAFGILSERPQDMQILAGMMPQGTNQVEASAFYGTYFFDGEGFPSSEALMENFRVIVADGIDFAALTQTQRDALNGWVTGGGMLVIGTGEAGARTLGGLELTAEDYAVVMTSGHRLRWLFWRVTAWNRSGRKTGQFWHTRRRKARAGLSCRLSALPQRLSRLWRKRLLSFGRFAVWRIAAIWFWTIWKTTVITITAP